MPPCVVGLASYTGAGLRCFLCPVSTLFPTTRGCPIQNTTVRCESAAPNLSHLDDSLSRRRFKRLRSSPSEALEDALRSAHVFYALPDPNSVKGKKNLSYVDTRVRARTTRQLKRRSLPAEPLQSLQSVLAAYIKRQCSTRANESDNPEQRVSQKAANGTLLPPEDANYLRLRGYSVVDLRSWYSILTTRDEILASSRIKASCSMGSASGQTSKPLPTFVFLFFLRRHRLRPSSIRNLILFFCWQLHRKRDAIKLEDARKLSNDTRASHRLHNMPMDDSTLFIAIVRLLRHARAVWPEALLTISRSFVSMTELQATTNQETARRSRGALAARWAMRFNRVLRLLSYPSPQMPFHSIAIQQRAQFEVLQRMSSYRPAITISREGYRAVIAVQLANKKTPQEHDWASLKAPTWPPWKQEKTGLDAAKGPAYGASRAVEAMDHARQAGYASLAWERVCQILAGWDTDNSPTIQTRALMLHRSVESDARSSFDRHYKKKCWAARIRATRTVQEAWACFLAFESDQPRPSQLVYTSMLHRLQAEKERESASQHSKHPRPSTSNARDRLYSAGDGKEIAPVLVSPMDQIYVRTSPPPLNSFIERMRRSNIFPTSHCLNDIISSASSLTGGLSFIEWATQADRTVQSLLSPTPENEPDIHKVDIKTLTAYIKLLSRYPCARPPISTSEDRYLGALGTRARLYFQKEHPIVFAYRLLQIRKPCYIPAWLAMLSCLAEGPNCSQLAGRSSSKEANRILRWRLMQECLHLMRNLRLSIDASVFWFMCRGMERAIFAAMHTREQNAQFAFRSTLASTEVRDGSPTSHRLKESADRILSVQSFDYIRSLFYALMSHSSFAPPDDHNSSTCTPEAEPERPNTPNAETRDNPALPRLLSRPSAQLLHAFVRITGLLRDWDGLLELVRWMAEHASEIRNAIEMPRNGPVLLRRTVVAVRVFSERSWLQPRYTSQDGGDRTTMAQPSEAAPCEVVGELKWIVESFEDLWGPWPDEEEMRVYMKGGRLPDE